MQSIYEQVFAFLVTIGIGFLAGIIFDIYRVFRSLWRPKKLGTFLGDLIFWLLMTIIVFALLFMGNWGEIRIYVFLGMALGAYLYVHYLSRKCQRITRRIFIYIYKVLCTLWRFFIWPFKLMFKIILIPVGFVLSGLALIYQFFKKVFKGLALRVRALIPKRIDPGDIDPEDEDD